MQPLVEPQSIRGGAIWISAMTLLVSSAGWLPWWAFYPLVLSALVCLIASVVPHPRTNHSRRSALARSAALAALVVSVAVTALAALDRFAAQSDVWLAVACWAVFGVLWLIDVRLTGTR
jgi:hypothetical protein